MTGGIETRPATVADADAVIADVQAGFDSYKSFAPSGWRPPPFAERREMVAELLADADTWALLALADGRPVGHVSFYPARERGPGERRHWRRRTLIPGLAHLWQLFVLPDWWGRGVAPALHGAAVAEMATRGFRAARLYTPTAHARARRFYERRGWRVMQDTFHEELALMLSEYRLELDGAPVPAPQPLSSGAIVNPAESSARQ
jgi:GNAT superfamily N-acetyltransferase